MVNLEGVYSLLVHRPRTVHNISHRCAITEITITFLSKLLLSLVFSLIWERRESEFALLILLLKPLSNVVGFDARDSLVFLIYSKEQISQSERVLFCIVDSQQMGVLRRTCTDRRVSATPIISREIIPTWKFQSRLNIQTVALRHPKLP